MEKYKRKNEKKNCNLIFYFKKKNMSLIKIIFFIYNKIIKYIYIESSNVKIFDIGIFKKNF
jgi:hypothetical protein